LIFLLQVNAGMRILYGLFQITEATIEVMTVGVNAPEGPPETMKV